MLKWNVYLIKNKKKKKNKHNLHSLNIYAKRLPVWAAVCHFSMTRGATPLSWTLEKEKRKEKHTHSPQSGLCVFMHTLCQPPRDILSDTPFKYGCIYSSWLCSEDSFLEGTQHDSMKQHKGLDLSCFASDCLMCDMEDSVKSVHVTRHIMATALQIHTAMYSKASSEWVPFLCY